MRSLDSAAMHVPPAMREIVLQNDPIQINRDSAVQYLLFLSLVAFDSIIKFIPRDSVSCDNETKCLWLIPTLWAWFIVNK